MQSVQAYRRGLARAASGQARQARRTAARMLASAVGFGVAYYFDSESGQARRRRLVQMVRTVVHDVRASHVTEPEPAVEDLTAVQRTLRAQTLRARAQRLDPLQASAR